MGVFVTCVGVDDFGAPHCLSCGEQLFGSSVLIPVPFQGPIVMPLLFVTLAPRCCSKYSAEKGGVPGTRSMLADGCASLGPLLRASCVGGGSAAAVNGTSVPGGGVAKGSTDFLQRDSMTVPPPGPRALAGTGTVITLAARTVILGVIAGTQAQKRRCCLAS